MYFVIDNKAILFFSFSLECISCYLVGRSDWKKKKKTKKKSQEVSEKEALVPQDDVRS